MSPTEYGAHLASLAAPLTDQQVEAAARLLASANEDAEAA